MRVINANVSGICCSRLPLNNTPHHIGFLHITDYGVDKMYLHAITINEQLMLTTI